MTDTNIPRRIVYLLACVLPVWAMVALYTGGVGGRLGPLRLSSREPWRPLFIGAAIAPANRLGGLDRAPIERIAGPPEVRLYQLQ